MAGQCAPRGPPVAALWPQVCSTRPDFHTGAGDLNSKYHVCAASTYKQSDFHDPPVYFNFLVPHTSLNQVEMAIMLMTKVIDDRKKKGRREEKKEMGKGDRRRKDEGEEGEGRKEGGKEEEEQQR